ncbi:hypothetical protein D3272_13700 [Lichenibacterium ramalinae]|uniref:DUF2946 domain-containing protein n=1 Tax=Lichenibacterium ramalinae TaxID=2316527 RepID=A0A4Q2RAG8_9HYPH|nr:hypothetical protein D3272_13700 [Lichenibacterium ramalinae]
MRRSLVAALIVALTLAGLGRATASAGPGKAPRDAIPGLHVPICHAGAAPADPARPSRHDCCGDCALLAAALVPPALSRPAPAVRAAPRLRAVAPMPAMARPRGPRLSRGPPAA